MKCFPIAAAGGALVRGDAALVKDTLREALDALLVADETAAVVGVQEEVGEAARHLRRRVRLAVGQRSRLACRRWRRLARR